MAGTTQDFISADSISWALTHTLKFGESDVFPVAFEYEAYKAVWPEVLANLKCVDLSAHEVGCSLKLLAPKGRFGYRAVTQLDPFDHLLYTGMIHEIAATIEGFRVSKEKSVACAYRVDMDAGGRLFQPHSGWPDFQQQSIKLTKISKCKLVVSADISDFYNQVSHHRVQNALASAGIKEERANNVEIFLRNVNSGHHSRGLPVGPSASILLAEACLADVDNFLMRRGYEHTRYVDDFRIFCRSEEQAISALHDLSEYLYTAHRLSLQGGKTAFFLTKDFVKRELIDPEEMERQVTQDKVQEILEQMQFSSYGDFDSEAFELDESKEAEFVRDSIAELFKEMIHERFLDIGRARYLLRRATRLRTKIILSDLLDNIQFFLPVLRDVTRYLAQVYDKKKPERVGDVLVWLASESGHRKIPYIQYWILDFFSRSPALCTANRAIELAESADTSIRDRMSALIAKQYRIVDWVRARKETWQNSSAFGQRAIIWAAPVLPKDERNHWLKGIANYPVPSTAAVAKAILSGAGAV
jgi:hypothetical protein